MEIISEPEKKTIPVVLISLVLSSGSTYDSSIRPDLGDTIEDTATELIVRVPRANQTVTITKAHIALRTIQHTEQVVVPPKPTKKKDIH